MARIHPVMTLLLLLPLLPWRCAGGCGPQEGPRPNNTVVVEHQFDLESTCGEITLGAHQDVLDRPYLYVAAKDGGFRVYRLDDPPIRISTLPTSQLGNLHAMNIFQDGNRLYLALGNTFGTAVQDTGMAILDVTNPEAINILSVWTDPAHGGTGMVVARGNLAFLGAMGNGVITFDVSTPALPVELSRFVPDITFPDARPDAAKINARGLAVAGNLLYVAYDAGGVRILDVTNPVTPVELGRYSNPALNGHARAYNNVVVDGTRAYVAFDYCGVEVLDVSNPSSITALAWWNPWSCEGNSLRWFSSDGHANGLALDTVNQLLFVSTGKSDLEVLDVTNPSSPLWAQEYGGVDNGIGTWGVSIHGSRVFLTYTCAAVPFASNWTGVKILQYHR